MSKRYFKIETGRYGGELAIGEVSPDFVEYWQDTVEDDGDGELVSTIIGYEWDEEDRDGDPNSPKPKEDFSAWYECDDFEHINGPFEDNKFNVCEIKLHEDAEYVDGTIQWKEGAEHDYDVQMYEELDELGDFDYTSGIYSRECYAIGNEADDDETVPVMIFLSSEKGGFGVVYVETNGEDFDPELLQTGAVETDLASIIEQYWYDRKPLQVDFDSADSVGKGYYAGVGYLNKKWHDKNEDYVTYDMTETENVKEAFEWFYEDRE